MTYNHCQCSRASGSSTCLPQSKHKYKLENSWSKALPSWGWTSVTSARTHLVTTPQSLVSCQPQLHQQLQQYWAVEVGEQEDRWPSIPSTTCTPWLLTVLSESTGVIARFLFHGWLKYGISARDLNSHYGKKIHRENHISIIHKSSSYMKSELVRVYNAVHLHNSTFFNTTFSSANIFHVSKLCVLLGN